MRLSVSSNPAPRDHPVDATRREFLQSAGWGAVSAWGLSLPLGIGGPRRRDRPFVMDIHVHLPPAPDPSLQQGAKAFRDELYRPWTHVYDGEGRRIPRPPISTPTVESLIELMDRDGIDVAVIMPSDMRRVAGPRNRFSQVSVVTNDDVANAVRKYPKRLIGIAGHDPLREEWRAEVELQRAVKELGLRGMKLYPAYHQYDPYDERLFPVYEKAIELDIPVTFHTGWTPLLSGQLRYSNPESLDRVGNTYPALRANLAHTGGPAYWREALLVVARQQNFTCDLSSWCAYPPQMLAEMLNLARDLIGLDRMLFGSEHTLCEPGNFVREIQNINRFAEIYRFPPFEDQDIENILGKNAARVYKWTI